MKRLNDYAPWTDPHGEGPWPTTHLPTEVVDQPFILAIDSQVDENEERSGGVWFSLNFNGRINPGDLTEEERDYIINKAISLAYNNGVYVLLANPEVTYRGPDYRQELAEFIRNLK